MTSKMDDDLERERGKAVYERCAALSANARRCTKAATHRTFYFGDGDLYRKAKRPQWVEVALCYTHRLDQGRKS